MRNLLLPALLCVLTAPPGAAFAHDDHAPHDAPGHVWQLVALDGAPFPARATLTFPAPDKLAGEAPCNRYFAANWGLYPWFKAGPIAATRRACPDLALEGRYLAALAEMTLADAAPGRLHLSSPDGRSLEFRLIAPAD